MALIVIGFIELCYLFVSPLNRLAAVIILVLAILLGIIVYGSLVFLSGLAETIFGKKVIKNIKNMSKFSIH